MPNKISNATHEIAIASAWKVFAALFAAASLMIILVPISRFGFVLFGAVLFGWLSSIAVELKKANGMSPGRVGGVGALGLICILAFAFPGYLAFVVPKTLAAFSLALSGLGVLGCMGYLAFAIDVLLTKLESQAEMKPKTNASLLLWLWPVGIWSLQPRLRQALRQRSAI